ncbi:MAG TPA: helix-turn-helix domain-containing protein [Acidimicrobiales bacterium]|nr:helix-turn-helix domain-containing protein [Acidimicrobiales bacterium]
MEDSAEPAVDLGDADAEDPLRVQLLDAAARVFASKGYDGTKIMDIVKAAGLSSGAVYGRFASKDELLMEAILRKVETIPIGRWFEGTTVEQGLVESSRASGALDDVEAMQLEAFIAARRQPNIADAITENRKRWRTTIVEPLIQRVIEEGSATPDADFESILYFIETLQLGLLVQRGAGQAVPDPEAWRRFVDQLLRAIGGAPRSG